MVYCLYGVVCTIVNEPSSFKLNCLGLQVLFVAARVMVLFVAARLHHLIAALLAPALASMARC